MKKRVTVIIERNKDRYYSCFVEDELPQCALMGYGNTATEAKLDMQIGYYEINEICASEGRERLPELTYVYKYDMQPFFEQFSWLNVEKVAEEASIDPSLMRQYADGSKMVGQKHYNKIKSALLRLANELTKANL